jgi:hypothetical protein
MFYLVTGIEQHACKCAQIVSNCFDIGDLAIHLGRKSNYINQLLGVNADSSVQFSKFKTAKVCISSRGRGFCDYRIRSA